MGVVAATMRPVPGATTVRTAPRTESIAPPTNAVVPRSRTANSGTYVRTAVLRTYSANPDSRSNRRSRSSNSARKDRQ